MNRLIPAALLMMMTVGLSAAAVRTFPWIRSHPKKAANTQQVRGYSASGRLHFPTEAHARMTAALPRNAKSHNGKSVH